MALTKAVSRVICPNCRTGNFEGSPYCSSCGASLHGVNSEATLPTAQSSALDKYLKDGQDPVLVRQILAKAAQILIAGEEIEYISIANRSMMGSGPACVVATNKRLMDYKRKMLGKVELDYCSWRDVRDVQLKEAHNGISLVVETIQGWKLTADGLPRVQAWKLYEVGAEHNTKLRAHLDQLLEQVRVEEQMAAQALVEPVVATTPQAEPVANDISEVVPPQIEYHVPPQSDVSAAGLLPLVVAPPEEPASIADWRVQPAFQSEPVPTVPNTTSSTLPSLGSLDDLFAPFAEDKAVSSPVPVAEAILSDPLTTEQAVPALTEEKQPEPHIVVPVPASLPHHMVTYQAAPQQMPLAAGANGSNLAANGSNHREGNGALHILKPAATPKAEQTRSKPDKAKPSSSQPAAIAAKESKQADTAPGVARKAANPQESPIRKLQQLKRMLDAGLISDSDYEAKKVEILSRF